MIDSESVYTKVTNDILAEYGKEMTWDIKAGLMGKPEKDAALHLLSFFPDISLTIDEYLTSRDKAQDLLWPTVPLLPGVSKLVLHLAKHAVPIAIATGTRRRNFALKTGHKEVKEVFQFFDLDKNVICGDPLPEDTKETRGIKKGRGKPHPDIFLVAAKECLHKAVGDVSTDMDGIKSPTEAEERSKGLVFEDAVPGVISAKRAGMHVVWVPDPNLLALGLDSNEQPDQILRTLDDFNPKDWGLPPYEQ